MFVVYDNEEGIYGGHGDEQIRPDVGIIMSSHPIDHQLATNRQTYSHTVAVQDADEAKAQEAALAAEREAGARRAEAEASKRQQEAAHNDAVAAFQTLLAETVKDPGARWQVSPA